MSFTVNGLMYLDNFINITKTEDQIASITINVDANFAGSGYSVDIQDKNSGGLGFFQIWNNCVDGAVLQEMYGVAKYPVLRSTYGSTIANGTRVTATVQCVKGAHTSAGDRGIDHWNGGSVIVNSGDSAGIKTTLSSNLGSTSYASTMWTSATSYNVGSGVVTGMGKIKLKPTVSGSIVINSISATITYTDGTSTSGSITEIPPDPTYLSVSGVTVGETAGTANLTVRRSGGMSYPTDLVYTTRDGSAIAGSDYVASSGTIQFPAGVVTQTITVPIISTPADIEGSEFFYINMYSNNALTTVVQEVTVYISSEIKMQESLFDLRREDIHQLSFPPGDGPTDPGTGQKYDGKKGNIITIYGGCNAKAGYYIYLDPRPRRVGFDAGTPGDEMGWRHVYTDGSTKVYMKEYLTEDEPNGHYEVKVESANSDGTWSSTEFSDPSIGTALQGAGTKELFIGKDNGDISVGVGGGTPITKSSGGDGAGVDPDQVVYIACPGPPHCVDGGFLGYIQGVTVDGWSDPSAPSNTSSDTTVDIIPSTPGTPGTPVIPDITDTVVFDTYRLIGKTVNALTTEFVWDTKRTVSKTVDVPEDGERDIVYIDEVIFDTYRLIGRTVNLVNIEFLWDTARIVGEPCTAGPKDTKRIISVKDAVPVDTKRGIEGTIDETIYDTKRVIDTSNAGDKIVTVGFDTKRIIIGDSFTEINFDTKRIIEAPPQGLPGYVMVFDTKRIIENNSIPDYIFDTKRIVKKPEQAYFDTKRNFKVSMNQTIIFDTKRRKVSSFWEIPEYDEYN